MGRRGDVLTAHGYKARKDGILTGHGQERCIDMTMAGKVRFSLVIAGRDGEQIGHGQGRWCFDCIWAVDMVY